MASIVTTLQKVNAPLSRVQGTKSNRMTHRPHSVKIEAKVVNRIENLAQYLIGCIKVPQICPSSIGNRCGSRNLGPTGLDLRHSGPV